MKIQTTKASGIVLDYRYELWVSDNGAAENWRRVLVCESEKQALDRANKIRDGYGAGCVEKWTVGTNTFVTSVMNWGC